MPRDLLAKYVYYFSDNTICMLAAPLAYGHIHTRIIKQKGHREGVTPFSDNCLSPH